MNPTDPFQSHRHGLQAPRTVYWVSLDHQWITDQQPEPWQPSAEQPCQKHGGTFFYKTAAVLHRRCVA